MIPVLANWSKSRLSVSRSLKAILPEMVEEWGSALLHCGWSLADLFSAHRAAPLARFDAMGLCLLLQGRKIGPVDQDRIAIRRPGGPVLHFRRRSLPEPEAVMLWELL